LGSEASGSGLSVAADDMVQGKDTK